MLTTTFFIQNASSRLLSNTFKKGTVYRKQKKYIQLKLQTRDSRIVEMQLRIILTVCLKTAK